MKTRYSSVPATRPPMHDYACRESAKLLHKFIAQADAVRGAPDPDAVHDLRVSIRRLGQCLRVFRQFFPGGGRRRVRRRLRKLMRCAAEVRNRDIAMDLLVSLGVPANSAVVRRMVGARARAAGELSAVLGRWHERGSAESWRRRLEL